MKKLLSVLLAVLLIVSVMPMGAFDFTAKAETEEYNYDVVYDYTTFSASSNLSDGSAYGFYDYSKTGVAGLLIEGSGKGINPNYGTLNSNAYGTLDNPYVIYEVKPGSLFEASLFLYSQTSNPNYIYCKEKISETTGEPFEFVIEASSLSTSGWKNAKDTSNIKDTLGNTFTFEYQVPEDCRFVKITFPNKGYVTVNGAKIATNDRAKLMGVRFFKNTNTCEHVYDSDCDAECNACGEVRTAPHNYEWVVDYAESCGVDGLKHEECIDCRTTRNENTIISATGNHNYEWIVDYVGNCGVDGLKHEECTVCHTKNNENTLIPATGNHIFDNADDTTCNVCGYVRGLNITYDTTYDYAYVDGNPTNVIINDTNKSANGIYAISGSNAASLITNVGSGHYGRNGIELDYAKLNANKWGTLENPYVIYEVTPGTYLEATLYVASNSGNPYCKQAISAVTEEPFEMKIEASNKADSGWKGAVDTSSNTTPIIVINYYVPVDCNFVKITYPQTGYIENVNGVAKVVANDLAKIMGVRFSKNTNTCEHVYDNDCDTACNVCGEVRTTSHIFDNDNDTTCNVCGYVRDTNVDKYTYIIENGKATIIGIDSSISGDVVIPSTLGGYPVTYIDKYGFDFCDKITSITIPDGVDIYTGFDSFRCCPMLQNIIVSEENPYFYAENGILFSKDKKHLYKCFDRTLTEYTIPDSVIYIDEAAFFGCPIEKINFGKNVLGIDTYAFMQTRLESVVIPDGVTQLGWWTFADCGLKNMTIPVSVKSIGNICGYGDFLLENIYYLGTESEKESIYMDYPDDFLSVTWHYESCIGSAEHTYYNSCDSECDVCGFTRNAHTYDDSCDTTCNECGEVREVGEHKFTLNGNHTCSICKYSKTPVKPIIESKTDNSVVLTFVSGFEYSKDGINWQKSNVFTGLKPNTTYTFYQRVAETDTAYASASSEGTVVTTLEYPILTPDAPAFVVESATGKIGDTVTVAIKVRNNPGITGLKLLVGYDFDILEFVDWDFGDFVDSLFAISPNTKNPISIVWVDTALMAEDGTVALLTFRIKEDISAYSTEITVSYNRDEVYGIDPENDKVAFAIDNGFVNVIPEAPQIESFDNTSVTLKFTEGYEYSIDGINWQENNVFGGLNPNTSYTFYQRFAETDTAYASESSEGTTVTTPKTTLPVPNAPEVESFDDTSVTLKFTEGYEYSIDGVNWQVSNVFEGLNPNTSYTFYQRIAETDTNYVTESSEATVVTTLKITVLAPSAPEVEDYDDVSVTLKATVGYEYSIDGINWQDSNVFTGLDANTQYTFYQRVAETDTAYASASSEGTVVTTLKTTVLAPIAPQIEDLSDTSVTLKFTEGYEYSIDGINWQESNVFAGLTPNTSYTFYQRIAETDTAYASESSEGTTVTTPKTTLPVPNAPQIEDLSANSVVLKFTEGYEYKMNDGQWQVSNVFGGLSPNTSYTFYQRIAESDTNYVTESSEAVVVTTLKITVLAPIAPEVEKFDDTSVTLKFTEGHEYSVDGINWQVSNVFEGLSPNTEYTFYNRIAETDTAYASASSEGTVVTTLEYPILTPDAPAFVVESATGKAGDTVTVAVKVRNNPGIAGLKLYVNYDSSVLEFVGGTKADFTDGIFSISPVEKNPISIVWTSTSLMSEDGTIALLNFRIKDGATIGNSEISVSYNRKEVYGEDTADKVAFAVDNGFVNVISYISGDVNEDGNINNKDLALLLRYVSDWEVTIDKLAADVNRDGEVDIVDLTILLQYLSDWDVELK